MAQGVMCLSGLRGGLNIDHREIILLWCDLNGGAENYMDKNWTRFVPLIRTMCLRPEEDENTIKQKYLQIMQKQGALPVQRSCICVWEDECPR